MRPICKVDGCEKPNVAQKLCDTHYRRWLNHGNPLVVFPSLITQPIPLKDRFWDKVKKSDCCWEWIGYKNPGGYGVVGTGKGKNVVAHRAVWFLIHGEWPKLFVLHKCDNRACVNPDHLWLGTQKDNMVDCAKKGRLYFQRVAEKARGPALLNKLKTHCIRGHELTGDNLRPHVKKRRNCWTCYREHDRRYKQKLRDEAKACRQ